MPPGQAACLSSWGCQNRLWGGLSSNLCPEAQGRTYETMPMANPCCQAAAGLAGTCVLTMWEWNELFAKEVKDAKHLLDQQNFNLRSLAI